MKKYWLAERRAFHDSITDAIAFDGKRFAGKHWLCGAVPSMAARVAGWAPPVVLTNVFLYLFGLFGISVF